jgi:hypothetical protein
MAAKGGSESKTGLVVSLVLFVLLSLILGVATYYGYQAADEADKKRKEADTKEKAWKDAFDWQQDLVLTLRSYIGHPIKDEKNNETATFRSKWNDGQGTLPNWDKDIYQATNRDLIVSLDKKDPRFGWDLNQKKPKETYEGFLAKLNQELVSAREELKREKDRVVELEDKNKKTEEKWRAAEDQFKKDLTALREKTAEEKEKIRLEIASVQKLLNDQDKLLNDKIKLTDDDKTRLAKDKAKIEADLRQLNITNAKLTAELEKTLPKVGEQPKGKIVRVDATGTMPFINLGWADNLKTRVTFSIHGRGPDGKALPEPKGSLEVVRIVGDHLAQTRITNLRDPYGDPVIPSRNDPDMPGRSGDLIFNPAWDPHVKQHVAIAGTIDLTGDGRDSLAEFIRTLEQQNVVVDSYLDMKAIKKEGEITRGTDMLILGTVPELTGTVKEGDPKVEKRTEILVAWTKMQEEAAKNGVRIVKLKDFLVESGYPLPRTLSPEGSGSGLFRSPTTRGSSYDRREIPRGPER